MYAYTGHSLLATGNSRGCQPDESSLIADKLPPSSAVPLCRANTHRDFWAVLIPQDTEPNATHDDVDYLVRLNGDPLKPSAVKQVLEVTEAHVALGVRTPAPVDEHVPQQRGHLL